VDGERSLEELVSSVEASVPGDGPLQRLAAARELTDGMRVRGDQLLDHFVDAARAGGVSWSEIGCVLGVSKQGAQQRFGGLSLSSQGAAPPGLSEPAAKVFCAAAMEARELGHHYVRPEHLVLGLFAQPEELAAQALAELGVSEPAIRRRIADELGASAPRPGGSLGVAPQTKRTLELARAYAKRLGHRCARTEHVLLAIVSPRLRSPAAGLLAGCGADVERVRDQLAKMLLLEAPELAERLQQRWPLATFVMRPLGR
jgi:hypothetical protein